VWQNAGKTCGSAIGVRLHNTADLPPLHHVGGNEGYPPCSNGRRLVSHRANAQLHDRHKIRRRPRGDGRRARWTCHDRPERPTTGAASLCCVIKPGRRAEALTSRNPIARCDVPLHRVSRGESVWQSHTAGCFLTHVTNLSKPSSHVVPPRFALRPFRTTAADAHEPRVGLDVNAAQAAQP
jgi:hypothetical protein